MKSKGLRPQVKIVLLLLKMADFPENPRFFVCGQQSFYLWCKHAACDNHMYTLKCLFKPKMLACYNSCDNPNLGKIWKDWICEFNF